MGKLRRGEKPGGTDTSTSMSQAGWSGWSKPRQSPYCEAYAKNSRWFSLVPGGYVI